MENIPLNHLGLTEDDKLLLRAFVGGGAYKPFMKLGNDALVTLYRQMDSAKDAHEIFVLQGRINGIRYMMNAPVLLTKAEEAPEPKAEKRPAREGKPRS